jgi:type VI secretion system secreted protein Hcp
VSALNIPAGYLLAHRMVIPARLKRALPTKREGQCSTAAKKGAANMASNIFLKIDGIKGESTDASHKDEIEVVSWSWGVSEVFISSAGSGIVGGKPKIADFVIGKELDKASPELLRACLTVKHITQAVLTQRKPGAGKSNFLTITLKDVLISSLNDADISAAPRPTESIVLAFGKVIYEYVPQTPTGKPGTPITLRWDVKANKEF